MSTLIQGNELRTVLFGRKVDKAATALVQNSDNDLFTISTGRIVLTSLVGEVTTAIGANAITIKVRHTPSGGSAGDLSAATTVTSDAAGTLYTLTTGIAADLLSEQSPAGSEVPSVTYAPLLNNPLILPAGTIDVLASNADPDGGAVKWSITYVPYDDGAAVVAA